MGHGVLRPDQLERQRAFWVSWRSGHIDARVDRSSAPPGWNVRALNDLGVAVGDALGYAEAAEGAFEITVRNGSYGPYASLAEAIAGILLRSDAYDGGPVERRE